MNRAEDRGREWEGTAGRPPEPDRWWEAIALTQGALNYRITGDLEVAVRALMEHLEEQGECSPGWGSPEGCAALRTVWELASHRQWTEAEAFFAEVAQDVLLE